MLLIILIIVSSCIQFFLASCTENENGNGNENNHKPKLLRKKETKQIKPSTELHEQMIRTNTNDANK